MSAQDLIDEALEQATAAAPYAGLVKVCPNDSPDVHEACTLLHGMGRAWKEVSGWLCLRVGAGDVVWDGRDYRALRLAAYQAEIPAGLSAEAFNEILETPPRTEKYAELQAIRSAIKARYPKPETEEE